MTPLPNLKDRITSKQSELSNKKSISPGAQSSQKSHISAINTQDVQAVADFC